VFTVRLGRYLSVHSVIPSSAAVTDATTAYSAGTAAAAAAAAMAAAVAAFGADLPGFSNATRTWRRCDVDVYTAVHRNLPPSFSTRMTALRGGGDGFRSLASASKRVFGQSM